MRLPFLPSNDPPPVGSRFWFGVTWGTIISCALWAVIIIGIAWLLSGCSPRAFNEVNKLAPPAPYVGERHEGMDRARYLRVTEREGEWK